MRVYDYRDGSVLKGTPSEELVAASAEAEPTGAVLARLDGGVWHHVPDQDADHYRRNLREDVVTVYVL